MVGLGDLPGGSFFSEALAISADGLVVVGRSVGGGPGAELISWTSGGGMVALGDLPGGSFSSMGLGVSADGSVIVGQGNSASGPEAFRWTSEGGMVGLGDLPGGGFFSKANGVSADGSVVVGDAYAADGPQAFIWDATNGIRKLRDVLANDLGLDLTGWTLHQAWGVSADGLTVVGAGNSPSGTEAWIATLGSGQDPADIDGDGMVGINDFLALLASWGPCPTPPDPCPADIDGDGEVGINDFLVLLASWG
jgi:probable HAF family extracellular repeat protein